MRKTEYTHAYIYIIRDLTVGTDSRFSNFTVADSACI